MNRAILIPLMIMFISPARAVADEEIIEADVFRTSAALLTDWCNYYYEVTTAAPPSIQAFAPFTSGDDTLWIPKHGNVTQTSSMEWEYRVDFGRVEVGRRYSCPVYRAKIRSPAKGCVAIQKSVGWITQRYSCPTGLTMIGFRPATEREPVKVKCALSVLECVD